MHLATSQQFKRYYRKHLKQAHKPLRRAIRARLSRGHIELPDIKTFNHALYMEFKHY